MIYTAVMMAGAWHFAAGRRVGAALTFLLLIPAARACR